MCGINGVININLNNGEQTLNTMNDTLSHRGPDAEGYYAKNNVHLGHSRLSIIDLSTNANQPFRSEDDNYILVYNGEVYNYEAIKAKYQLNCSTTSDTEVILKAFIQQGPAIFSELNGMFALAIFDKKNDTVILARDRVGIKPLFIYEKEGGIAFSSELNALKKVQEIKTHLSINQKSITSFLHLGYIPAPMSIYNEVSKFPAGSYATFKNGQLSTFSYWKPEEQIKKEVITDKKTALNELDTLLNSSVELRLKCDVPFGTFLSGGIDSSIVTSIAQQNTQQNINTFSIGFKEKSHSESVFAGEVAKKLGTNHNEFIVSEKEALTLLPEMFSAYGEPYADSSAIPTMMVSKLAREKVKMTLSGDGGDELFHGYGFYNWASRLQKPLVKALRKPIYNALKLGNNRNKRAAHLFNYPKKELKSHIFSQEQYFFSSKEISSLVKQKGIVLPPELNYSPKVKRALSPAEEQSLFDLRYYLKDELLVKVDIATMNNSLETRVPLLDHRIVEFALNLDPALKIKDGEQKYLLKRLLYEYLPKELFDRPKQGFSIPLASWLKGDLKHLITDFLNQKTIEHINVVHWEGVKKLLDRFQKGEDYLYTRIWALIVLHQWLIENN